MLADKGSRPQRCRSKLTEHYIGHVFALRKERLTGDEIALQLGFCRAAYSEFYANSAAPGIRLEFGARSTGEPCEVLPVVCDLAPLMPEIVFSQARPRVMKMERTFWEKATAIHVFCRQAKMRGNRFARHWHDLLRLAATERIQASLADKPWLEQVVRYKAIFFQEKDQEGVPIDYRKCLNGHLCLVPEGAARETLREDYNSMIQDGIVLVQAQHLTLFWKNVSVCKQKSILDSSIAQRLAIPSNPGG